MQAIPSKSHKRYTYADYKMWDDKARYELIDGVPYIGGKQFTGVPGTVTMMTPPPARKHQGISMELSRQISNFLHCKPCMVYAAPFAVRLNAKGDDDTVVEPDIVVVCDNSKLSDKGCDGAPDMVIEILSPSTARLDRIVKFNKYLGVGVREYWIVDPDEKAVSVHVLKDGEYFTTIYVENDTIPVAVLGGCQINMQDVFAEES